MLVVVHKARFLTAPLRRNGGRRRGNSFRLGDQAQPSRVSKHCISAKPQKKPVKYANGKKDSASHQEAPETMCKASEDVG